MSNAFLSYSNSADGPPEPYGHSSARMADTKRPNAGGKVPVATPNIGATGIVSLENALSGVIGARIRVTTSIPSSPTLEGTVFTACPITNLLALTIPPSTYHILPITAIQSFTLLSLAPSSSTPFTSANPPLSSLSTSTLQSRADAAVARLKEAEARKGKGVGKEAQDIFDAMARTLPTRWDGTNIIVLDAILIGSPYRPEDCKAGAGVQAGVLGRVKKVLEIERKKLADKATKPAVPAIVPAGGPRKGG